MITLVKNDYNNGNLTCRDCEWYETGDQSIGIDDGCTHPILYDEQGSIIDEVNDMIIECMENPEHCILFSKKRRGLED